VYGKERKRKRKRKKRKNGEKKEKGMARKIWRGMNQVKDK
jgi:hypothetical protein